MPSRSRLEPRRQKTQPETSRVALAVFLCVSNTPVGPCPQSWEDEMRVTHAKQGVSHSAPYRHGSDSQSR